MIFQNTTRANQAGFDLTPQHLFHYRTIRELAKALAKEKSVHPALKGTRLISASRDAHRVSRASLRNDGKTSNPS